MYFPIWEKNELLAVGEYLKNNCNLTQTQSDFISKKNIINRFDEFGGIFRSVFAKDSFHFDEIFEAKKSAINKAAFKYILQDHRLDPKYVSHYICKMVVDKKKFPFQKYKLDFINDQMHYDICQLMKKATQDERIRCLKRNMETGALHSICSKIFEEVIIYIMSSKQGCLWKFEDVNLLDMENFAESKGNYPLKSVSMIEGLIPPFSKMKSEVLYYSLNPSHKAIEAILKLSDSDVIVFQMKWTLPKVVYVELSDLDSILKKYQVPSETKVIYGLFPKPGIIIFV